MEELSSVYYTNYVLGVADHTLAVNRDNLVLKPSLNKSGTVDLGVLEDKSTPLVCLNVCMRPTDTHKPQGKYRYIGMLVPPNSKTATLVYINN